MFFFQFFTDQPIKITPTNHLVDENLERQFGVDGVGSLDDDQQPAQGIIQRVILPDKRM